jgi:hypothetical protein
MIRHDQEVERPVQPHRQTTRRRQLFATREAVSIVRAEARAERASIHGHPGVQVRIAPEHLVREVAPRVGREVLLRREGVLGILGWSDKSGGVLRHNRRGEGRGRKKDNRYAC